MERCCEAKNPLKVGHNAIMEGDAYVEAHQYKDRVIASGKHKENTESVSRGPIALRQSTIFASCGMKNERKCTPRATLYTSSDRSAGSTSRTSASIATGETGRNAVASSASG